MINRIVCLALTYAFSTSLLAQQAPASPSAASAAYASARGNDSYLRFGNGYEKGKAYTVFNLYPAADAPTESAKMDMEDLKKQLSKRNTSVVDVAWTSEADLTEALKAQNISATVSNEKHIRLKGDKMNLSTTSGKALLVIREGKVVSLCSGGDCNERLKKYFGLTALN